MWVKNYIQFLSCLIYIAIYYIFVESKALNVAGFLKHGLTYFPWMTHYLNRWHKWMLPFLKMRQAPYIMYSFNIINDQVILWFISILYQYHDVAF